MLAPAAPLAAASVGGGGAVLSGLPGVLAFSRCTPRPMSNRLDTSTLARVELKAAMACTVAATASRTVSVCCTCTAALKAALPAWLALITHAPALVKRTTPPLMVQALLAASIDNATTRPELAVDTGA